MSRPTSDTNIANLALRLLKIDPVGSISPPDSNSKAAAAAAAWFDQAKRETLEAHPWNFALKRIEIASDATAPIFEYTTRYELPADFVRMGRIGEDWNNAELDFELESGDGADDALYILCDVETPLQLVYVADVTDVSKYSPKFITSMAYKLASLMGYEMTGNQALVGTMNELFIASLSSAASIDGQNRPTRVIRRSKLADARRNTGTNRDWMHWSED